MSTYPTIVFDLDGTLIHSAPDLHAAVNVALLELERSTLSLKTVTSFIGNGVEKLVERSLAATGGVTPDLHSQALALFLASYTENMTTLTRPYPGVVACLSRLQKSGIVLGICTNKPTAPARDICDQLDLTRYFDVILGAEPDCPKKPEPQPLIAAISELGGTPGETLYVGDSEIDCMTARNANVSFRLFSGGYLKAPIKELSESQLFSDWGHSGF